MTGTRNMLNTARAAGAAVDPGVKEHKEMKRKFGFTLIELLVVIAIISILAAIVTPKVQGYILRGRMTNSVSEVVGIDTAIAKMLTDSGKSSVRQMFDNAPAMPVTNATPPAIDFAALNTQIAQYTDALYALLRQGRNAPVPILEGGDGRILQGGLRMAKGVKDKLATSYLDANFDAWDRKYQFWAGPWSSAAPIPFRSFRPGATAEDGTVYPYAYSTANDTLDDTGAVVQVNRKTEMDSILPGNPTADEQFGYPAPKDLVMYVFSTGVNVASDQLTDDPNKPELEYKGGGDDINNWDKEQGWTGFYS